MKILLLAPHPFYQERGTPIAVKLLATELAGLGHSVDLLTWQPGETTPLPPGVRVYRARAPLVRAVRPGFSLKKLWCDVFLWPRALRMARAGAYDSVHAVEESVFIAMHIRARGGPPYVFDMDSSMPRQMVEKCAALRPLLPWMLRRERAAIRAAAAVVPVCDYLAAIAREAGAARIALLRDVPMTDGRRTKLLPIALPAGAHPRFLYVGNLETYQGIDLLLHAFARYGSAAGSLTIVGGARHDVARYRRMAERLGIGSRTAFTGPRPLDRLGDVLAHADILVSPRLKGGNTPMKIYSYLASRRPVLATDIASHTQVMDTTMAVLCPPEPASMAAAMRRLAEAPAWGRELAERAAAHADAHYSLAAYRRALEELYPRDDRSG